MEEKTTTVATTNGGEGPWAWGAELDPMLQVRRVRGLVTGRRGDRALREAVEGRRILLTGASSGIGRETARRLGHAGAEMLLVARRRDRLEELAEEVRDEGGAAHVLPCDLTSAEAIAELVEQVRADHGAVDVLVNNAGHSIRRTLERSTDRLHDFERVMELNYFGAVRLTVPLVADMRERKRGHVVNVSTMGVQFGYEPRFAAYLASKAAVDAFTRSAAPETRRDHVHWTTVYMPLVRTDMITPTKAFHRAPAMSVERGAGMVLDGIVRRPVRVTHPFGTMSQAAQLVIPRRMESAMARTVGRRRPAEPVVSPPAA
ncbi:SDR family NAD(P)-dependent oxidoreductase [Svornostia abyssi]|uniref:SDR family NAD(P)-dependent oxidoreductase n=1 Tax=Svornostia abyssi TaxID=2898438 RepID=A0ABY5PGF6_9ACTN|nr:SDR family NAD(P)-dependent oxidoreductase [Parviterribacteraceae bacterium J379]